MLLLILSLIHLVVDTQPVGIVMNDILDRCGFSCGKILLCFLR